MARNGTLTEGRAGSLHLIGGRLCLDFANTSSGRGTDQRLEQLRSYGDLVAWSAMASASARSNMSRWSPSLAP